MENNLIYRIGILISLVLVCTAFNPVLLGSQYPECYFSDSPVHFKSFGQVRNQYVDVDSLRKRYEDIDSCLFLWKMDSLGCLGYRYKCMDTILSELLSKSRKWSAARIQLGSPNQISTSKVDADFRCVYYIKAHCDYTDAKSIVRYEDLVRLEFHVSLSNDSIYAHYLFTP